MHGLKAALGSTLVEHVPGLNRLGESLEVLRAEVSVLEQAADKLMTPWVDDHTARLGQRL